MNDIDKQIVQDMIDYIEDLERKIQAAKLGKGGKTRAVSKILEKLEKETKDEN